MLHSPITPLIGITCRKHEEVPVEGEGNKGSNRDKENRPQLSQPGRGAPPTSGFLLQKATGYAT